jgi:putative transposase
MSRAVFRFRMYPTSGQEERMFSFVEAGRRLWNMALEHRNWRWEKFRQSTGRNLQSWILTAERKADPKLGALYAQSAQDVLGRLDQAFRVFFKGIAKRPKFKSFRRDGSFTYPQAYNGSVTLNRGSILLSKVGEVPIVVHRKVPQDGRLKVCTIRREACGEWYAILTYETDEPLPAQKEIFESPVGVDLGLKSIITTTDGLKVEPPHFFRKPQKRLRRLQRQMARRKKGGKNREYSRHLVAVQHAKVARQRENFNHVLSASIVAKHDFVAMEDLRIRNMVKNHHLAKSIQDAAWGQLKTFVTYKERRTGGLMQPVEPAYTTQDCFFCRARNKVTLDMREFVCVGCGRHLDRDFNASWRILSKGLQLVGQDMPELTPSEMGPPPIQPTGMASLVVELGTTRPERCPGWKPALKGGRMSHITTALG